MEINGVVSLKFGTSLQFINILVWYVKSYLSWEGVDPTDVCRTVAIAGYIQWQSMIVWIAIFIFIQMISKFTIRSLTLFIHSNLIQIFWNKRLINYVSEWFLISFNLGLTVAYFSEYKVALNLNSIHVLKKQCINLWTKGFFQD